MSMQLADPLSEMLDMDSQDVWESERTPYPSGGLRVSPRGGAVDQGDGRYLRPAGC